MRLIICEKPSVAREFSVALGAKWNKLKSCFISDEFFITYAIGHMRILHPEKMGFSKVHHEFHTPDSLIFQDNKKVVKQLNLVVKLINSIEVDEIVNACDPDRAGEQIFWNIYKKSKSKKLVRRFWSSEVLTPQNILKGLESLSDSAEYYAYSEAEDLRNYADLVLGYNCSTSYALQKGQFGLSVGRVQSPVLVEVVKRYLDNKEFKSSTSYHLQVLMDGMKDYVSSEDSVNQKLESFELIEDSVKILKITDSVESSSAPELYNKSTLITDAASIFKINAETTSKILQDLYQNKKITSYPRTGSKYLDEKSDTKNKFFKTLQSLGYMESSKYLWSRGKSLFNNSKVQGHYALIIMDGDKAIRYIDNNSDSTSKILRLIRRRMLIRSCEKVVYNKRLVEFSVKCLVDGSEVEFNFSVEARSVVTEGWLKYHETKVGNYNFNKSLFELTEGDKVKISDPSWRTSTTKAPPLYTSGSIIKWMEKHGIGTPATIESFAKLLVAKKYLKKLTGDKLVPTELGLTLYHDLSKLKVGDKGNSSIIDSIMNQVIDSKDQSGFSHYKSEVDRLISEVYDDLNGSSISKIEKSSSSEDHKMECLCGSSDVSVSKFNCKCNDCSRTSPRLILGKSLHINHSKELLKGGSVFVKGMRSNRTKKLFSAHVIIDHNGKMEFKFK